MWPWTLDWLWCLIAPRPPEQAPNNAAIGACAVCSGEARGWRWLRHGIAGRGWYPACREHLGRHVCSHDKRLNRTRP